MARRTGLSLSYLHYIERDQTVPGVAKLEQIADALSLKRSERAELLRHREIAELRKAGVERPELAVLVNEYSGRISEDDLAYLMELVPQLASGKRTRRS